MLEGESDSYAGTIGRPDLDYRIVALALVRSKGVQMTKALAGDLHAFRAEGVSGRRGAR